MDLTLGKFIVWLFVGGLVSSGPKQPSSPG